MQIVRIAQIARIANSVNSANARIAQIEQMDHLWYANCGDPDHCAARLNLVRQFLEFGGLRNKKSGFGCGGIQMRTLVTKLGGE